jgi:hypothetical protein
MAGKLPNLSNLELPVSGLYLLAAPSTPEEVRAESANFIALSVLVCGCWR